MRTFFVLTAALFVACLMMTSAHAQGQNYKIKQKTGMSGMESTSTVYVKGQRKRTETSGYMGIGGDIADVEQCDLKRTLKINDKKKLYVIEPFATPAAAPVKPAGKPLNQPKPTKGGTVTINSVISDTGERKQMFGLTARHIKTSMTMTSSPDACSKSDMKMETDGWYVDLPGFSCPMPEVSRQYYEQQAMTGCRDEMVTKSSGAGKKGFALEETTTMNSGGQGFTTSISTLEFSRAALPDSLFDIPAGYAEAKSANDLASTPDYSAMMNQRDNSSDVGPLARQSAKTAGPKAPGEKKPGMVRVGVMLPVNRGEAISLPAVQRYFADRLTAGNVEGVAVSSEAEAKTLNCDYIVTSEFSKLKQSTASKIGGIFGAATGTDTGPPKYDAQIDFKVVKVADGKAVLQKKAAAKTETDAQRAAEAVVMAAAAMVMPVTK